MKELQTAQALAGLELPLGSGAPSSEDAPSSLAKPVPPGALAFSAGNQTLFQTLNDSLLIHAARA